MPAPICLFVFNRPEHTARTLDALSANPTARDSELHIFSDAPRTEGDAERVNKVRKLVHDVRGFNSVSVVERERNFGLAASITDGVGRLCERYGRVIVVEDDIVVAPGFLSFMNRCLNRYADDEKVMQISGYMYPGEFGGPGDTLFLPMISCWGWGTWTRAWSLYDPNMSGYGRLVGSKELRAEFNLHGAYDYLGMLEQQRRGEIDSWGIRWHLSVFMLGGLVLYPAQSLVINAGIDGSGTHGRGTPSLQMSAHENWDASGAFTFPATIETNEEALSRVAKGLRAARPGIGTRLKRKIFG